MKLLLFFISFLIVTSLANAQTLEYGYVFHENTEITHHILKDGKEIPIQFSTDSNQEYLKMLSSLKWNILYPNSRGEQITLKGVLSYVIKRTPEQPNIAMSQNFQDFKLISWYIKTPFKELKAKDINSVPHEYVLNKRNNLKKTDFKNYDNKLLKLSEIQH